MLFRQLGRAHSLREVCGGLVNCEGKLRHPGLHDTQGKELKRPERSQESLEIESILAADAAAAGGF